MKLNWAASIALVLSAVALGLSSIALYRVTIDDVELPNASRIDELPEAEPSAPPMASRSTAQKQPMSRPLDAPSEGADLVRNEWVDLGVEAGRSIDYAEELDPDDMTIRYDESSEVVDIGPPLDPDAY